MLQLQWVYITIVLGIINGISIDIFNKPLSIVEEYQLWMMICYYYNGIMVLWCIISLSWFITIIEAIVIDLLIEYHIGGDGITIYYHLLPQLQELSTETSMII